MQLSKEYIVQRLQDTSVKDLAEEITDETAKQYPSIDRAATLAKFTAMLEPLAPKTIKATDAMRALGVSVVEVA